MRTLVVAFFAGAAVLAPTIAPAEPIPVRRTVVRSAPAAPHVRVDGAIGDIQVIGDDAATVRVTARIRASSDAAAARVGVDVTRAGEETVVSVKIPESSPAFVHWLFDRSHISVDVQVRVPHGSVLAVRSSTGDLDVRGVVGPIDARTTTGDVALHEVATNASATATTGDVAIEVAPHWNGSRLAAHTSTGDVRIRAFPGLHARVDLRSRVGEVHNAIGNANVASPVIEASSRVGDVTITTQ